ncbi:MAG: cysteine hydrolase family protein [Eubacteriales bacterium]|jgi:nicotinamidase-related amidase|nr:cysteine hydrolase family protein [Eubacteriales bacterium]
MRTALLFIDVQQALIDECPARMDEFMLNLKMRIDAAHKNDTEVIYVRHDGGENDVLAFGSPGWQLERSLTPRADERVFDKRFGSAFRHTGLHEYLTGKGIARLVVCGMQTEYCIDTSVKVAFEHGYEVDIPSEATTTYAYPFLSGEKLIQYYERMIWQEPLARVADMEDALSLL